MRHTVSDGSGRYDPLDIASLQLWQQGQQEDNRQQIRRLLVNLPLAVEEELTPRQRQLLRALECIVTQKMDLAIFDVMLPDIDGFRICQKIREEYY